MSCAVRNQSHRFCFVARKCERCWTAKSERLCLVLIGEAFYNVLDVKEGEFTPLRERENDIAEEQPAQMIDCCCAIDRCSQIKLFERINESADVLDVWLREEHDINRRTDAVQAMAMSIVVVTREQK